MIESDDIKNQNRNLPSNYLIVKVSDNLNMLWELEYTDYRLSDVLFEYVKKYIVYKISRDALQKKEIIEINDFHKNVLFNLVKGYLTGFSNEPIPLSTNSKN